jgi:protein TonB
MFEVFTAQPRQGRSATPVVVSIVGHALVLGLVIVIPLLYATDSLPKVPSMMAFVAAMPEAAPPPPPPPPPPPQAPAAPEKAVPKTLPADAFAAPVEAPADIRPELPGLAQRDVVAGVEGGVIGGVQGGIVGGLIAAPPPPPPPPPPPAVKQPVRIGGNIQAPALVKRVEPVYPDIALVAKVTGLVILEASVGVDGTVESVRVLRSVKFLDQAAVDAVKQWKYSPLVLNGVPTPFVLSVTLNFSVKEG